MKREGWTERPHAWEICDMCGPMVVCGHCGNICCNGGTGDLQNGSKCGCDEAYALQNETAEYMPRYRAWIASKRIARKLRKSKGLPEREPNALDKLFGTLT